MTIHRALLASVVVAAVSIGCASTRPVDERERAALATLVKPTTCNEPEAQRPQGLEKADVLFAVKQAVPALHACCPAERRRSIKVLWVIECDGRVTQVVVPSEPDTASGQCLRDVVAGFRYPTQAGPGAPPVSIPLPCGG